MPTALLGMVSLRRRSPDLAVFLTAGLPFPIAVQAPIWRPGGHSVCGVRRPAHSRGADHSHRRDPAVR